MTYHKLILSKFRYHMMVLCKPFTYINYHKMLSYRRETTLQGVL